jgi:D-cysteine desulfhydrase
MEYKMISLFKHYPLLRDKLPYISLGEFPTPIEKLERLGKEIRVNQLFIKRDDLSSKLYGGNKIRKLEFILGDAQRKKVKEVLTFGFAGSNHAVATALYAKQVGMKSISMLMPQPNAYYVRKNLLLSQYCGAELHNHRNIPSLAMGTMYQLLRHKLNTGYFPYVIAAGGSSTLGIVGFINAALELKEQIQERTIPEPDYIYVALGTMGTALGLIMGLKIVNLKSRVISVRVVDEKFAHMKKMIKIFHKTNSYLHSLDPSFPKLELSSEDIDIRHAFYGKQYALFTEEGMKAIDLMHKNEGITLDGTYTGKAFAALIDDAERQDLREKVVLLWNTYNSRDYTDRLINADYHKLPQCFHRYFEKEVQPLDIQGMRSPYMQKT